MFWIGSVYRKEGGLGLEVHSASGSPGWLSLRWISRVRRALRSALFCRIQGDTILSMMETRVHGGLKKALAVRDRSINACPTGLEVGRTELSDSASVYGGLHERSEQP